MATDSLDEIPHLIRTVDALRAVIASHRELGKTIGLVPTMGALHDGHLSLVENSQQECDVTVTTIFVNPTQFGPQEDLDKYPRTLARDLELLAGPPASHVFVPSQEEIYPPGFSTFVDPPAVALPLEGAARPGHFRGVATVVLKLFNLVQPDVAYFGQKDYQQCLVVRRMVEDLGLPISIRMCPIVRDPDGLAMSSRNRYLSPAERGQALAISRALAGARRLFESGQRNAALLRDAIRGDLEQAGLARIDYVEVADPATLAPVDLIEEAAIALIAAHVGKTRLIDNSLLQ